jgi:hypothetical protein
MTDSKGTVTNAYASGDTVTLEITWQGTHNTVHRSDWDASSFVHRLTGRGHWR